MASTPYVVKNTFIEAVDAPDCAEELLRSQTLPAKFPRSISAQSTLAARNYENTEEEDGPHLLDASLVTLDDSMRWQWPEPAPFAHESPAYEAINAAPAFAGHPSAQTSTAASTAESTDEEEAVASHLDASWCTLDDSRRWQWSYAQPFAKASPLLLETHDAFDVAEQEATFEAQTRLSLAVDTAHADIAPAKTAGAREAKLKLWCHFYLNDDMLVDGFHLAKKIIGKGGEHTKRINSHTDAKVRLRGKGSGHHERDSGEEARVPLMVAVTASPTSTPKFVEAVDMAIALLQSVETKYKQFLKRQNRYEMAQDSRSCFWIGALSQNAKELLASNQSVQDLLPMPSQDDTRMVARRGRRPQS